ncbi:MAG TPA: alpha-amylase family glycosyl hydrolase [Polyangia bacterium]
MPTSIDDPAVQQLLLAAQRGTLTPTPFPSPADWRDVWIYFLLIDRFNRHDGQAPLGTKAKPPVAWGAPYGFRQGGDLKGVRQKLSYLAELGVKAIWLSPVLKNARPAGWAFNYHGYGAQDFLNVDERLGSDGTRATAETELRALVDGAHHLGIYVILDIVLNHAGRVFDYVRGGGTVDQFTDDGVMQAPAGQEPPIEWMNGLGLPRADWTNVLPAAGLGGDDAVWPTDLQRADLFRRRGEKLSDQVPTGGFVSGDFGAMRQLVVEYDADAAGDPLLRQRRGRYPVLDVLVKAYSYLIARYDFDGFRIDTVKYVSPSMVQQFGNAVREFALGMGKKNFFTFGEIYDDEKTIAAFVGRNAPAGEGFGIDAALDFPLFFQLPAVAKGLAPVESIAGVYQVRKDAERSQLSSHGEAGQYFVSFLDNHDQDARVRQPSTPADQVTLALGALFTLPGIPSLYYGTEQELTGTQPTRPQYEGVREALWGKPHAFDTTGATVTAIKQLAALRAGEPALRFGRLYFRPVSANGADFGSSRGNGGLLAYARILSGRELVVVANCQGDGGAAPWRGFVAVDLDLNRTPQTYRVAFSNRGTSGAGTVALISSAVFWDDHDQPATPGSAAALFVALAPGEIQILAPE